MRMHDLNLHFTIDTLLTTEKQVITMCLWLTHTILHHVISRNQITKKLISLKAQNYRHKEAFIYSCLQIVNNAKNINLFMSYHFQGKIQAFLSFLHTKWQRKKEKKQDFTIPLSFYQKNLDKILYDWFLKHWLSRA